MKNLCLTIYCIFILSFSVQSQTLHAVIFADSKDSKIGLGSGNAYTAMTDEATIIAKKTNLKLETYYYNGEHCKRSYMRSAVSRICAEPNDVILFFSSSHGYNEENSLWPTLVLRELGASVAARSVKLDWVINELKSKKARLTIIINQSCNKPRDRGVTGVGVTATINHADASEYSEARYKELFLNSKGTFIMTSSQKGEYSYIDGQGGFFVHGFLEALHEQVKLGSISASWSAIKTNSIDKTQKIAEAQYKTQKPYATNNTYEKEYDASLTCVSTKECDRCDGDGTVSSSSYKSCGSCGGDGKRNVEKTCNTCDGDGYTYQSSDCSGCYNGYISSTCSSCFDGTYSCSSCSGYGGFKCSSCGGDGRITSSCSSCSGYGKFRCNYCGGSGRINYYGTIIRCTGCSGYGAIGCTSCGGSGKRVSTCYNCSGYGVLSCSSCGGDGQRTCSSCGGDGVKTYSHSYCGGDGRITKKYNCSRCGGDGEVYSTTSCYRCNGDGEVYSSSSKECSKCDGDGRITEACCNH